jgi:hypothetical protein
MRLEWNPTFSRQAEQLDLRYSCADCGHFDVIRQVCAHGWPMVDHRQPHAGADEADREVVFCKEFELL